MTGLPPTEKTPPNDEPVAVNARAAFRFDDSAKTEEFVGAFASLASAILTIRAALPSREVLLVSLA
ncbi:MAG: hypothetical protein ACREQT_15865, partial [Candidatus Binataceae bacterium]